MANNIDIKKLESEIKNMINDLDDQFNTISSNTLNEVTESQKFILKQKYSYLHDSSLTLFNMILSNFKNKTFLRNHISVLIENLTKLQKNELTEYNASVNVGTHFANEYFPKK
jgi:hypothetical protein